MKLTYLPDEKIIIQGDADRPIVASLSMASLSPDTDLDALGRAMAAAPQLLALIHSLFELKANRDGFRVLNAFQILKMMDAEAALGQPTFLNPVEREGC